MSTRSEVAKRVGVSEATVSRVLNGKPGASEATRQAVLAALDVLGYDRPAELQGGRTRTVGLLVPDISNPIFAAMSAAIGARLAASGMAITLATVDPHGRSVTEAEYLELMLSQQVSGVILTGGQFHRSDADLDIYRPLSKRGIPTVLMNTMPIDLPFATVTCDDRAAATLAWRHLRALGHEHIGMVLGPSTHLPSRRRVETVAQLSRAGGVTFTPAQVKYSDHTIESAQMLASELLREQEVSAIICASDLGALGVIRAGERLGLKVPDDLSVVGYDDSILMAHTSPPLTTLRQPVETMSSAAVRALVQQLENRPMSTHDYLLDPELIVRGSTAIARSSWAGGPQ